MLAVNEMRLRLGNLIQNECWRSVNEMRLRFGKLNSKLGLCTNNLIIKTNSGVSYYYIGSEPAGRGHRSRVARVMFYRRPFRLPPRSAGISTLESPPGVARYDLEKTLPLEPLGVTDYYYIYRQ